ncbi:hypothetical protein VYU27_009891, partial [Nannochloropsis oceanica]
VTLNELASFISTSVAEGGMGRGVQDGGRMGWLAGVTNIGARFLGGWMSDFARKKVEERAGGREQGREGNGDSNGRVSEDKGEGGRRKGGRGMRGRMLVLFCFLVAEGAFLLGFSHVAGRQGGREGGRGGGSAYTWACVLVVLFSSCVQAASGAVYALVPYLSSSKGGASVAGIVGGGGNVGAVAFTLLFMGMDREAKRKGGKEGFRVMGLVVLVGACAVWLLDPKKMEEGHREVVEEEGGREEEVEKGGREDGVAGMRKEEECVLVIRKRVDRAL